MIAVAIIGLISTVAVLAWAVLTGPVIMQALAVIALACAVVLLMAHDDAEGGDLR